MDYYKYYEHHYYGWNVTEAGIVMTKQNQEDAYFEEFHKKFY